jgi:hypothetical protein
MGSEVSSFNKKLVASSISDDEAVAFVKKSGVEKYDPMRYGSG